MESDRRSMWEEQAVGTHRMPDPVRAAAVRAVLIAAVALTEMMISVVLAMGQSWLSAPMTLLTVLTSVGATWAVLDVWVTRQVWSQRGGVVSSPSSVARARRRERRRARRAARAAGRDAPGRHHRMPRAHGA